jgi:hypothetical protein
MPRHLAIQLASQRGHIWNLWRDDEFHVILLCRSPIRTQTYRSNRPSQTSPLNWFSESRIQAADVERGKGKGERVLGEGLPG